VDEKSEAGQKDERTIVFDLGDLDSIAECKRELKAFAQAIWRDKVEYSSPVFRTLGVAAATTEEKDDFLEKITRQIDSVATDVSSLDATISFGDLDQIPSIAEDVSTLKDQVEKMREEISECVTALKKFAKR
jgi:methyl-accepting chemotaxis protein